MQDRLGILKAMADETRLRILALLRRSELTVGELVDILQQSQPRVSRHIKILLDAGLVNKNQEGTWVFCRFSVKARQIAYVSAFLEDLTLTHEDQEGLSVVRERRALIAADYFRQNAANWEDVRKLYISEEEVETALLAMAGNVDGGRLLDIGTGTGRILDLFHDRIEDGLGVDISPDMLTVARSRLIEPGHAHLQVRRGDMYALPEMDESRSLIIFHQVLHFADDPAMAVREAARVLEPGGKILIADFSPHENEELRQKHAHRRLGFDETEVSDWARDARLVLKDQQCLSGGSLDVMIWCLTKSQEGQDV